jgi:hypothetical protein
MTKERFARNPKIVRLLNRYPNPPNKDIGEGLRTAFQKMQDMRLKPPVIRVDESSVTVTLPHETLAAPEDAVVEYLKSNDKIDNRIGRELTGIKSENQMKEVFYRLRDRGLITLEPAGGASYWRHSTEDEAKAQVAAARTKRGQRSGRKRASLRQRSLKKSRIQTAKAGALKKAKPGRKTDSAKKIGKKAGIGRKAAKKKAKTKKAKTKKAKTKKAKTGGKR